MIRWLIRRRHGALLDSIRRSTELLDGDPTTFTLYWREERDYIQKVNRRLIREYDPKGVTDRKVR